MKIFLLRHEKRYDSSDFDTDLTEEGFKNAEMLSNKLSGINIDLIFCSPYKRVIQTLEPYLKSSGMKINLEYGLYESLNPSTNDDNIRNLDESLYGFEYADKEYVSSLKKVSLYPGENYTQIKNRVNIFMKNIIGNINLKNKTILIVSHLSIINAILGRDEEEPYDMGQLSLFYNSGFLIEDF